MIRSASLRMGCSRRRSSAIAAFTGMLLSGCGRRVSLKRRTSDSSEASRNSSLQLVERLSERSMAGRRSSSWPSRISTTSAVRSMCAEWRAISAKRGINSTGRLSTQ